MATWIGAEDGSFVNLDLCQEIRQVRRPPPEHRASLVTKADGKVVAVSLVDLDPNAIPVAIVPAAAGTVAFSVYHSAEDDQKPRMDAVVVETLPICAWNIQRYNTDHCALPIFADPPCDNATIVVPRPDGKLDHLFVQTFEDLDEVKREVLRVAIHEWEKRVQEGAEAS